MYASNRRVEQGFRHVIEQSYPTSIKARFRSLNVDVQNLQLQLFKPQSKMFLRRTVLTAARRAGSAPITKRSFTQSLIRSEFLPAELSEKA